MRKVRDVMARQVPKVDAEDRLPEVARAMKRANRRSLPVQDGDRLIGVISDRDIAVDAVAREADLTRPVREFLTGELVTAGPDLELSEAARLLVARRCRVLVVVERGEPVGLVDLDDAIPQDWQGVLSLLASQVDGRALVRG